MFEKFYSSPSAPSKKKNTVENFCCSNALPLLIKLGKLKQNSTLISVRGKPIKS